MSALLDDKQQPRELHIASLSNEMTLSARSKLFKAARGFGGTLWDKYRNAAIKWAALCNDDKKWHIESLRLVYMVEVAAPLIDMIAISDRNLRFVIRKGKTEKDNVVLTFAEFAHINRENVVEHLEKYKNSLVTSLDDIIKAVQGELVSRKVSVVSDEGVKYMTCVGLSTVEPKLWRLPEGVTFLNTDDDQDS